MAKRFGFTLAEVLITLGIIGVVAAMTIPTLMNSTGQAEFKTGYKKAISTLNQAVNMNVALDNTDFSALATGVGADSVYQMFMNRMNVVKTATDTAGIGATSGNYTLFFNDGMAISFDSATAGGCTNGTHSCNAIVDVNGPKKPNTPTTDTAAVKDQFAIRFEGQQVVPNSDTARSVLYLK